MIPIIDHARRLVHLHAPKTGGTFVRNRMLQYGAGQFCGQHDSFHLHRWCANPPWTAFGTVRNPWDWYPSWHAHAMSATRDGIPGFGREFRDVLRVATSSRWCSLERPFVFYDRPDTPWGFSSDIGLCSASTAGTYSDGPSVFIPTDRLNEGLALLLKKPISESFINTHHQRDNTESVWPRPADHYADWYDDEMIEWVAKADAALIERFGFEPFTPSPKALYRNEP